MTDARAVRYTPTNPTNYTVGVGDVAGALDNLANTYKTKAGWFDSGDLDAGEYGIDTTNGVAAFSSNGTNILIASPVITLAWAYNTTHSTATLRLQFSQCPIGVSNRESYYPPNATGWLIGHGWNVDCNASASGEADLRITTCTTGGSVTTRGSIATGVLPVADGNIFRANYDPGVYEMPATDHWTARREITAGTMTTDDIVAVAYIALKMDLS
jgi:hypothetical protein